MVSCVTCHVSNIMCHVSSVICYMTHVICHLSPTGTTTDPPPANSTTMHSGLVRQKPNPEHTENMQNPKFL